MKPHRFFNIFIFIFVCSSCLAGNNKSHTAPRIILQSKQMIVVVTDHWASVHEFLYQFQRKAIKTPWVLIGKPIPVIVGGKGLGWSIDYKPYGFKGPTKKEGDTRAPAGVFKLSSAFGTDPGGSALTKMPYIQVTHHTICVDDPSSKYYNQIIDTSKISEKDWKTAEKMWLYDDYQWGIFVDHNKSQRNATGGSCVFIHLQGLKEQATIGCTALSSINLKKLLNWITPKNKPILIQLPAKQYFQLKKNWQLPSLNQQEKPL